MFGYRNWLIARQESDLRDQNRTPGRSSWGMFWVLWVMTDIQSTWTNFEYTWSNFFYSLVARRPSRPGPKTTHKEKKGLKMHPSLITVIWLIINPSVWKEIKKGAKPRHAGFQRKKKKDFHKYILGVETRALSVAARPHAPESQDHSWLYALAFFWTPLNSCGGRPHVAHL